MSNDEKALVSLDSNVLESLSEIPSEPDEVSTMSQAKGLIVAGVECVPVLGKVFGEMTKQVLKAGDYSPEKRLKDLQFGWLVGAMPSLDKKIECLLNEGVKVEAPDIGAIFEAALDASRKTTGKKRQYLKSALENAFSLKVYEEGQVLRFFNILGELEYGDIFALEWYVKNRSSSYGRIMIGSKENNGADSNRRRIFFENRQIEVDNRPEEYKKKRGEYYNIIPTKPYLPDTIWSNLDFHCLNLMNAGLVYATDEKWQWGVRSIAEEFIWFVTADDEDLDSEST